MDLAGRVSATLRDVPDFPRPGILFKDITPVLADPPLFGEIVGHFAELCRPQRVEVIAAIESRGFILGGALALALGSGFVPLRKPGRLPHHTIRVDYELEYGSDALEAHVDAVKPGARVLLVDDVLATGGTAGAAAELIRRLDGELVGAAFLVELSFLAGRSRLQGTPTSALVAIP